MAMNIFLMDQSFGNFSRNCIISSRSVLITIIVTNNEIIVKQLSIGNYV